mgnify:CR=1 FL=1
MINLSDKDILDYLMTSDFQEGLKPSEFQFLLKKFRYFYKISRGKNENLKTELEAKSKKIEEVKYLSELNNKKAIDIKKSIELKYNRLLNRKLTWKERFLGKIINKK